jgi:hypothetical protein
MVGIADDLRPRESPPGSNRGAGKNQAVLYGPRSDRGARRSGRQGGPNRDLAAGPPTSGPSRWRSTRAGGRRAPALCRGRDETRVPKPGEHPRASAAGPHSPAARILDPDSIPFRRACPSLVCGPSAAIATTPGHTRLPRGLWGQACEVARPNRQGVGAAAPQGDRAGAGPRDLQAAGDPATDGSALSGPWGPGPPSATRSRRAARS